MATRGTIKNMGSVANDLAGRDRARDGWAVYDVKKNGELYARAHETFRTEREAHEKAAYWTSLNPGCEFRVVERYPVIKTT